MQTYYSDNQDYMSANLGFKMDRLMLAGGIRLTVKATHENLWYNSSSRGLPDVRDLASVTATTESENVRFRPYASYGVALVNYGEFTQIFMAGVTGPITDQLLFDGQVGVGQLSNNNTSLLWKLSLKHTAGPYTNESLSFGRSTDSFYRQVNTYLAYGLTQILGPCINARFIAIASKSEDLTDNGNTYDELSTGVALTYFYSTRTEFSLGGNYQYQVYQGSERDNVWIGRFSINHRLTDSVSTQLTYQYRDNSVNVYGNHAFGYYNGFYENMVMLTVTKYFQ